jgi:hypothetical protein
MPKILKAPRKSRNQLPDYRQTLAPSLQPVAPMAVPVGLRWRYVTYAAWAITTVLAGITVGVLVNRSNQAATSDSVAPTPIEFQQALTVSPQATRTILPASATTEPSLSVSPGSNVDQADGGTPYATVSASVYQPEVAESALDPGATNDGTLQGTTGTSPVQ